MRELNQNELEDVNGGWVAPVGRALYSAGKWLMSLRGAAVTTAVTTAEVANAPTNDD